jgi:putative salt-induced outer membrane protein YdiY
LLNPKLLFLLVINLAVLALNFARFADGTEEPALTNEVTQIEQSNNSETAEKSSFSEPPRVEKQKNDKKLVLLEAKLAQAEEQNKILAAQIKSLNSELTEQNNDITALQKNNVDLQTDNIELQTDNIELQKAQSVKPAPLASEADLLRTNIQSQPDLLHRKPPKSRLDKTETTGEVAAENDLEGDLSGAVEFGFSYAQDNKVTRSVNGRLILDYERPDLYAFNSNLKFELEDKDNQMSAEKYRWQLQADDYLDQRNLIFIRSDMQRNQFASYVREDIYTMGYGRIIFDQKKHKFNIEIGPGYRMAVPNVGTDAVSIDEFIIRTRLNYERIVSESLQLKMDTVLEIGKENSTYAATFKAQNKIYRELYLIFDVEYKYTENVPVDSLNKEVTSGLNLMYAF